MATRKISQLLLDAGALFEVHDGGVGDVADMNAHNEVDEGIPKQETLVDLAMRGFENIFLFAEIILR